MGIEDCVKCILLLPRSVFTKEILPCEWGSQWYFGPSHANREHHTCQMGRVPATPVTSVGNSGQMLGDGEPCYDSNKDDA